MNEPSAEAKQAAGKWWNAGSIRDGFFNAAEAIKAFAEGYDAATAKLRAENERLITDFKNLRETYHREQSKLAKLREENDLLAIKFSDMRAERDKLREENTTMREQWHEEHEEMADYILELRQKLEALSPPSEAQQQKEGTKQ